MGVWSFAVNGTGAVAVSASDDKGNPDTLTGRVTDGAVSISTRTAAPRPARSAA